MIKKTLKICDWGPIQNVEVGLQNGRGGQVKFDVYKKKGERFSLKGGGVHLNLAMLKEA